MAAMCHNCSTQLETDETPGRTETCPNCDADLHCCLNCRFYDPSIYNECRESQAERVLDKDRSNFCDYFSFRQEEAPQPKAKKSQEKVNPLDALFKK